VSLKEMVASRLLYMLIAVLEISFLSYVVLGIRSVEHYTPQAGLTVTCFVLLSANIGAGVDKIIEEIRKRKEE